MADAHGCQNSPGRRLCRRSCAGRFQGHRPQTGQASADEWTVVRDTHDAIVSRELFDAVQKALDHAAQQAKDREIHSWSPNLLRGENLLRPLWAQPSPAKMRPQKDPRMYMSTTASATTASRKALALARLSLKKSCWMPWPI